MGVRGKENGSAPRSIIPVMAATVAASTGHEVLPTEPASPESESQKVGGDEDEDITFEEAQKRAAERAEAALQCSIDNKVRFVRYPFWHRAGQWAVMRVAR
jgi:ribonucleoside-diphosphate reductase subunit M1